MTGTPRVAAICVTHNSSHRLLPFLEATNRADIGLRPRVVIVDSGSTDDTVREAKRHVPENDVLELEGNRGYAAGINLALRHLAATGGADVVLVLNPDVTLGTGTISHLVRALESERVGIAVPQLRDEHGRLQLSLRRRPSLLTLWCEAIFGGPLAHRLGLPTEVVRSPQQYGVDGTTAWATGGAMALSMACIRTVGAWDESFFMYDEEVDYCLRAADAGYSLAYVASATATRDVGDGDSVMAYVLMRINRVALMHRRGGSSVAFSAWCGLFVGELLRAARGRREARHALWALLHKASPTDVVARLRPRSNAEAVAERLP